MEVQKRILKKLKEERDFEVAKYVSAKVDHYFKDSNVAAARNIDAIKSNFKSFTDKIDVDSWSKERGQEIDEIISTEDYFRALKIFKNKGLESIANTSFGIKDFNQKAFELLSRTANLQVELKKNLLVARNSLNPLSIRL